MVQPTTIQRAPRLWVALLGIVILTAAAAFVVREVYRSRPEAAGSAVVSTTPTSATTPSSSSTERPGPPDVQTRADAAEHPQYKAVRQMLQDYFDGINNRNYSQWRGSVTKARADLMPEKDWKDSYQSSKDGNIHLYRIDTVQPGAGQQPRLRVLVSFTSTQSIDDAPDELKKGCIDWHVVLPVSKEDNKWRIDTGDGASSPRHDECGSATS